MQAGRRPTLEQTTAYTNDEWDRCTPSDKKEKHSAFPAAKTKNSRDIPTISLGAAPQPKSRRETRGFKPRIQIIRFPQSLQHASAPPQHGPVVQPERKSSLDELPKLN
jgi:hypothetical protein